MSFCLPPREVNSVTPDDAVKLTLSYESLQLVTCNERDLVYFQDIPSPTHAQFRLSWVYYLYIVAMV